MFSKGIKDMCCSRLAVVRCIALLALLLNPIEKLIASEQAPLIAAASSIQFALQEINQAFAQETGHALRISYGSSGNLARQINQGGSFEIFLAADQENIERLVKDGLTRGNAVVYTTGRLVLFSSLQSKLKIDSHLSGLKQAVKASDIKHFSIANPAHAPYGAAAKQVLQNIKLWASIKPRLVFGENIAQAAQFAVHGAAQGGIIAYSFALEPKIKAMGRFVLIPQHLHQPLKQSMVLLKNAGETAKLFFEYLQQPTAQAIFSRTGFNVSDQQDSVNI